jgi:hypothetical protein
LFSLGPGHCLADIHTGFAWSGGFTRKVDR